MIKEEKNKETRFINAFNKVSEIVAASFKKLKDDKSLGFLDIKIISGFSIKDEFKMSELAKNIKVNMSVITGAVDRLINKNLVIRERNQNDRRVVTIRLTEMGKKILLDYETQQIKLIKNVMMTLSAEEQDRFIVLMEKIVNSINKGENK